LTVAKVVSRSRTSRKTFYDAFLGAEDCFLAVFEQTLQRAREVLQPAYASQPDWRTGIRAAVLSLLTLMDEEPGLARLWVVETLAAGRPVLVRRAQTLEELARAIDQVTTPSDLPNDLQQLTAHAVVGAVTGVLHRRLLERDSAPLTDLAGSLMSMIVMPYLGQAAAWEELSAPSPATHDRRQVKTRQVPIDPLEGLNMRLTYRTVRVLIAIAETPGASNRQIARDAGIVDQGQISKLLRRLAATDLIENVGAGQAKGMANAWRLTARGARLQKATLRR
jgi:AcrR family transcriptional regulator